MSNRKLPSNGLAGKVFSAQINKYRYDSPAGYPKLLGIDRKRWDSFCSARETWSDAELVMLFEGIVAYRDLDACRDAADGEPIMVPKSDNSDCMIANPVFHELRQREKAVQTWLRQVGLTTSPDRAAASKGSGLKRKPDSGNDSNVRSLIG
jgi:hypothetical protein